MISEYEKKRINEQAFCLCEGCPGDCRHIKVVFVRDVFRIMEG